MRFFAALLILLLGGCGLAVSDKPMFTDADAKGAPPLENGVWLMPNKDENDEAQPCAVDVAQPVSTWPKCVDWALYRDGQWFERDGETGIATKPMAASVLITGGDVAIVQVRFDDPDGDAASSGEAPSPPIYFFAAFADKPVAADAKLRTVKLWVVACGIHKPNTAGTDEDAPEELVRFAGFDEDCRPDSVEALRAAARMSRTPNSKFAHFRWARATLD
jgi:hypothetical protein